MTLLVIVAIHTAANEPPKVRQVMNKIHRNVGEARGGSAARAARAGRGKGRGGKRGGVGEARRGGGRAGETLSC